ncbi:Uncharacterised protein [Vibrio cholerae]|nr:Uncharacterised protein [Vibrio cholerae]
MQTIDSGFDVDGNRVSWANKGEGELRFIFIFLLAVR